MHIPQHNQTEPCVLIDWSTSACVSQRTGRLTPYERHTLNRALRLNGTTLRWISDEQTQSVTDDTQTHSDHAEKQAKQTRSTSIRHIETLSRANRFK